MRECNYSGHIEVGTNIKAINKTSKEEVSGVVMARITEVSTDKRRSLHPVLRKENIYYKIKTSNGDMFCVGYKHWNISRLT